MHSSPKQVRVLFVADSVQWVTGTLAKNFARFNPWIEATIVSGQSVEAVFSREPELVGNFDLVHFTCPYASRDGLLRFRESLPCVTSHHHTSEWELMQHNLDGDAIVVGSPEWVEDLRRRGADPSKLFFVPYGVDAQKFVPATVERRMAIRASLGIGADDVVVGFFGKNNSNELGRKGIDVFAAAIRALKDKIPATTALVVGPGWQEFVSALTRDGVRCVWLPFARGADDLAKMYQALDFYWVTSRVEGGPVTLLEAMSSEVCCLTTPVGIAREIVRNGENALLLPFNDPAAFSEASAALAARPMEREQMGRRARATILEKMRIEITAPQILDAYAKAFDNYYARTSRAATVDVRAIAAEPPRSMVRRPFEEVPLSGFPPAIRREVRIREALLWSENLIQYHGEPGMGLRMIVATWLRNPLSTLPLRALLRRFLPVPVVASAVALKRRLHAPSKAPADRALP